MKRTPLRRSSKPIRRKGKSVKAQCVELFMRQYRGNFPCEVCVSFGKVRKEGTCGHHIIKRSIAPHMVCDPANIIILCTAHHAYAHDEKCDAFKNWLATHRATTMEILQAHRNDKTRPNYRALLEQLRNAK